MPFSVRSLARGVEDGVVGGGERVAQRPGAASTRSRRCRDEPGANRLGGNLRGALARELAADAVDHAEDAAAIVEEEAVFVVVALQPGVRVPGRPQASAAVMSVDRGG